MVHAGSMALLKFLRSEGGDEAFALASAFRQLLGIAPGRRAGSQPRRDTLVSPKETLAQTLELLSFRLAAAEMDNSNAPAVSFNDTAGSWWKVESGCMVATSRLKRMGYTQDAIESEFSLREPPQRTPGPADVIDTTGLKKLTTEVRVLTSLLDTVLAETAEDAWQNFESRMFDFATHARGQSVYTTLRPEGLRSLIQWAVPTEADRRRPSDASVVYLDYLLVMQIYTWDDHVWELLTRDRLDMLRKTRGLHRERLFEHIVTNPRTEGAALLPKEDLGEYSPEVELFSAEKHLAGLHYLHQRMKKAQLSGEPSDWLAFFETLYL